MEFSNYSKSNKAHKFAAPTRQERKQVFDAKPRNSDKGLAGLPRRGLDFVYGLAHIKSQLNRDGHMGWCLPGCVWTDNNGKVLMAAMQIDQMIRAGGGLPKGWVK